jgi:hypothetical protein
LGGGKVWQPEALSNMPAFPIRMAWKRVRDNLMLPSNDAPSSAEDIAKHEPIDKTRLIH